MTRANIYDIVNLPIIKGEYKMNLNELVKSFDNLPQLVKIILALPGIDIIWVIYRIVKSASENNLLGIILGVVILFVGIPFLWIIDIICIIMKNTVWWF